QSRSSLVVFFLMCLILLVLTGRRIAPIAIGIVTVAAILFGMFRFAPSLNALLSVGVQPGDIGSLDALLSGRLLGLCKPLLEDWLADPTRILFGSGRFGMMTSHIYSRGAIYGAHPHNALIEVLLDGGLVLAVPVLVGIWAWLRWSWRTGRRLNDDLFW